MRDLTQGPPADRLEQLVALSITTAHQYDCAVGERPVPDLVEYFALAKRVVQRHGGLGSVYRHDAVVQHLLSALMAYTRSFEPRSPWRVLTSAPTAGQLRWTHPDPEVPDVVDVLAVRGIFSSQKVVHRTDCVVRLCDLMNRDRSLLTFPGDGRTYAWCPADDPIFSRELAVTA